MSSKVRLLSWSPGLNKVRLTKLIREAAGIPLNEAHDFVNRLLTGEAVEVAFSSDETAIGFIEQVRGLGINAVGADVKPATGSEAGCREAMEDSFQDNGELYRKLAR